MNCTVLLGDNEIKNCDAALVVNGQEVFRLRERSHDGQLVVDFDVRDASGNRIAKIAKNHVVHTAEGWEPRSRPGTYELVNRQSGDAIARVREISPGTVQITGDFWIDGHHVNITDRALVMGNGITLSGNTLSGAGTAIELNPGSFAIGIGRKSG